MGQVSRTIINGLLNKQSSGKKVRRRGWKPAEYERQVQEYLYTITHRFIGLPPPGNRWWYPDIFLWDEDQNGDNLIPAFVAFYFNQTYAYPYEKRWAFEHQLNDHIPDKWDCYWFFAEGYIYAERREEGIESFLPQSVRDMNRHAAHRYDVQLAQEFSHNGHREVGENENVVFVVPDYE